MRAVATLLFCHTFDREDVGIHELVLHPDSSVTFTVDLGYKSDKIGDQLWSNQPFTFESRLQIGRGSIAVYTFFTRLRINFIRIEYCISSTLHLFLYIPSHLLDFLIRWINRATAALLKSVGVVLITR